MGPARRGATRASGTVDGWINGFRERLQSHAAGDGSKAIPEKHVRRSAGRQNLEPPKREEDAQDAR